LNLPTTANGRMSFGRQRGKHDAGILEDSSLNFVVG